MDPINKDQAENMILKNNVSERTISDNKYAPSIVKTIVFGLVSAVLFAVIGTILGVFDKKVENIGDVIIEKQL